MQNIDIMSQQTRQNMQQRAQDTYLTTLGQTAAAQAQQSGMQFQSENAKQMQLLGLEQDMFQGGMTLDQSIFDQQQQAAGNVQNAKSAMWGGAATTLGTIGSGLTNLAFQDKSMKNYMAMRNA
jgi:hypothetical protein